MPHRSQSGAMVTGAKPTELRAAARDLATAQRQARATDGILMSPQPPTAFSWPVHKASATRRRDHEAT